jgi:Ran GTPase-activating protein (RanGAP) involved in mRNA processing and transport
MNTPILDEQGPLIVQGIRFCRSLCVLDLSANLIGDTTMFEFEKACLDHPKLRFVNFEGNLITEQGSYSLSKVSRQFQSLNVSHNKIGAVGVAALLASAGQRNCRLESLYLQRNRFEDSNAGGGEGPKGIALNTTLRNLNLSFMNMIDANSLGAGLIMNKFLVEIDLSQNELEDDAVEFMTGMASNQSIEFIDFSFNRIGTRGALWILKGLAEKLRNQSQKLIQVRLLKNFYDPNLEGIISDMNNKHLSAAIRIERCAQYFLRIKMIFLIVDPMFRAESAINGYEKGQIAKWKAMDTHLFEMQVLLAYGDDNFSQVAYIAGSHMCPQNLQLSAWRFERLLKLQPMSFRIDQ